jgi:hypothetical protein
VTYNAEMLRAIAAVFVLTLGVGVAAGYGGSSLQAIAHQEAKYFGVPRATITRIETVRIWGARPGHERWAMIQMKGRHPFTAGCPRPGPGIPGPCGGHYLEVGVDLANHKAGLYWGLTASEVSAITKARKASRLFRIFPDTPGLYLRCAIPSDGLHRPAAGTCSTVAEPSDHVRRVEFVETWRTRGNSKLRTAGWVVTLSRSGRVQSIRVKGQPPQLVL